MTTPATIAAALHATVDEALRLFSSADDTRTALRPGPGKWSPREVLGHLVDSACNNHRRFVMAQAPGLPRSLMYRRLLMARRR